MEGGSGIVLAFRMSPTQKQARPKLREVGRGSFMTLVSARGATNKALSKFHNLAKNHAAAANADAAFSSLRKLVVLFRE